MTTIDELGRRAAEAARADAAEMAAARVESGLDRLRFGDAPVVALPRPAVDPRRWVMLGTAVAVAAAAIIALVVNANEGQTQRVIPGGASTQVTTASTSVSSTGAPSTTEATKSTDAPVVVPPSDAIAVDHSALPAAYPATPIASVGAPADPAQMPLVAVGDSWIVTVDTVASVATLIDRFSPGPPTRQVPLTVTLAGTSVAAGPGDVLYGVVQGTGADVSLVAIALSGDRAGQVVASAPISAVEFAEAPSGVLGHGSDGIIDRRTGKLLLGYVDASGASTSIGRAAHIVGTVSGDVGSGDAVIRDPDGKHDWHLAIRRGSPSASPFTTQAPPAPSSHGGAVVWTDLQTSAPTAPAIAVLAADGTGVWYSLADGWQVAASDLDGTMLMRRTAGTVELARLDPPQRIDFLDRPTGPHQRVEYAVTLPTTLTSAPPCTIDDLAIAPTADGAMGTVYGRVSVRNKGDQPCEVDGFPDVAFLDDTGTIVQSTEPSLLAASAGTDAVILERDSWAAAQLGAIASNVCGGNQSSQFRLTIGGRSAIVPFAVGGPIDQNSCDPSANHPAGPGALAVEAFAPVQPNTDQASPFDGLQVAIEAPATVRAGEVLHYDVVMTAPDTEQVLLDGTCPVYTHTLGTVTGQLLLNCTSSDGVLIGVGESVRFHIDLPIPAGAAVGTTTLTWTPVEPSGPAVTAKVAITP